MIRQRRKLSPDSVDLEAEKESVITLLNLADKYQENKHYLTQEERDVMDDLAEIARLNDWSY